MQGGTTFHFVTDGIESALEQAQEAAGGKDVHALAAAPTSSSSTWQPGCSTSSSSTSCPLLLGGGARLFDGVGDRPCSSSRSGRSRRPASRTSSTAAVT